MNAKTDPVSTRSAKGLPTTARPIATRPTSAPQSSSSPTGVSPTTVSATRQPLLGSVPVFVVCGGAGVLGAAILFGYGTLVQAIEGPLRAGDFGASSAAPVTPANFSIGVVFCTVIGTLLAVAVNHWAKRPSRTFARVAIALVAVSLASPLAASHTTEATRLTLALGHVLAASIIIPIISGRLRA